MPPVLTRPGARRQIDHPDLWIFWRDAADGRGREGFACRPFACTEPDCDCTEVMLQGVRIDGRAERVEATASDIEVERRADLLSAAERAHTLLPERATVMVDFATGEAAAPSDSPTGSAEVAAWIAAEADRELLDRLHERWLAACNRTLPALPADYWRAWRPGLLIERSAAFPEDRWDVVADGGARYRVEEAYCPDPDCPCGSVQVWFEREDYDGPGDPPRAALRIDLPSLEPVDVQTHGLTETDVRRFWARLRARSPDLRQALFERGSRMKTFRPPVFRSVARAKVGRNDPCPCGSGRKFKKCCEGRVIGMEGV